MTRVRAYAGRRWISSPPGTKTEPESADLDTIVLFLALRDRANRATGHHRKEAPLQSSDLAIALAALAVQKKAIDPVILDVEALAHYCTHFVVLGAANGPQARAIAQHVTATAKAELGERCSAVEGLQRGRWVLLDFGDVLVHIFDQESRGFYDLEGLWVDAPRLPLPGDLRAS